MAKLKLGFPAFRCVPTVLSGQGALKRLAELDVSHTLFFLSGQSQVHELLFESIASDATPKIITKPSGEPTIEGIRAALEQYQSTAPTTVVVMGGGSTLDWARLVVLAGCKETEYAQRPEPTPSMRPRLLLIPTTPATGAEAGTVAVYQDEQGIKKAIVDNDLLADEVILDERVIEQCDAAMISLWLADALSHNIEALQSIVAFPMAEQAAKTSLNLILENDPTTHDCNRSRLMEAGYLAGTAAAHCSVGIAHAFAHAIASDGFSHSFGNAIALDASIQTNAPKGRLEAALSSMRLDFDSFRATVEAITRYGASAQASELQRILAYLEGMPDGSIAAAMRSDVSSRSNPVRVSTEVAEDFIQQVTTRVRTWLTS